MRRHGDSPQRNLLCQRQHLLVTNELTLTVRPFCGPMRIPVPLFVAQPAAAGFLCRVDWLRPSDVYGVNLNQIRALRLSDETGPQQHSLHHAAAWRGAQRSKCACEIDASVSESILPPSSRLSGADEQQRSSKCRICYSERCHLSRVV